MSKKHITDTQQAIFDLRDCAKRLTNTQAQTDVDLKQEIKKLEQEADKLEQSVKPKGKK